MRAALESVAYQTADLFDAIDKDGVTPNSLRIDGGMAANDWAMQFLADMLDIPVERPEVLETTALGAAYLAGLQAGIFKDTNEIAERWRLDARFQPAMGTEERVKNLTGWKEALKRALLDVSGSLMNDEVKAHQPGNDCYWRHRANSDRRLRNRQSPRHISGRRFITLADLNSPRRRAINFNFLQKKITSFQSDSEHELSGIL